ncbi:MAG: menaquinone-dependent protoporphyrinogen IX dehydrogenase [Shewanella sp.]|nr:menaquinone-dependent protoporphyrinogen IX dehydrogenase [Shewanella sp.]
MQKILMVYSTVDGQTKEICEQMQMHIGTSADVDIYSLKYAAELDLNNYQKIVVGASIRYGKFRPELFSFIEKNKKQLIEKKSSFFSVNVVARKPHKNTPQTNPYMKKFLEKSPWQPDSMAVFAGKIDYPKYGWFDRTMIRFIMWMTKGPTDINGCYEFTDWDKVEQFAQELVIAR